MENIIVLLNNYSLTTIVTILILTILAVFGTMTVLEKVKEKLNIYHLKKQHEESMVARIEKLEAHDNWQYSQIQNITECMKELKEAILGLRSSLDEEKEKADETKRAELRDRIAHNYRIYNARKFSNENPVPYWNEMEKEAFEGLIRQYEAHGGTNSFVHSEAEPKSMTWVVVEMNFEHENVPKYY